MTKNDLAPDIDTFLSDPENLEKHTTQYCFAAIEWLSIQCEKKDQPWTASVDSEFIEAAKSVVDFLDGKASIQQTAQTCKQHLANWRGNLDAAVHPISHLGRVMRGDPGNYLEYKGPLFLTTINEILEGLTYEEIMGEWDLNDEQSARMLMGLGLVAMGTIAQAAFWALKGKGTHLDRELSRIFSKKDNREALRGQLANLDLAGRMAAWGHDVEFVPEADDKTPDWKVVAGGSELWVECTSVDRNIESVNDHSAIGKAVADAWRNKSKKFGGQFAPGVIALDMSGLYVSREYGTVLKKDKDLLLKGEVSIRGGKKRTCGVYAARDDVELMSVRVRIGA